jgi:lipid II:glycine glycyltransferase (peptidoglycan interpeptide bridge formation enzyme)
MKFLTSEEWGSFLEDYPNAHILQTPQWGKLKDHFGWTPRFIRQSSIGAMILFRKIPLGLSVAYIPRGPVGDGDWRKFWPAVDALCRQEHAVFLRVEPEIWEPTPEGTVKRTLPGFKHSAQTVQPPRTMLIDLTPSEEDILMEMKSKTRYNIRLAGRKDVVVRQSKDVERFYQLSLTTSERDEFGIHSLEYYQQVYDLFAPQGACVLLIAQYQDQPLAGLMAFARGDTAWYFYGASNNQERNRMPTYTLQWEAIRWAKEKGCLIYDLWGVPDHPESYLEDHFLDRSDGLWGVYRFKRGFGGKVRRTIGTWDRVYHPAFYQLYQFWAERRQSPST